MTTIDVSVTTGLDDAHSVGSIFVDTDIQHVVGNNASPPGVMNLFSRFQSVAIPQGTAIDVAYLTVTPRTNTFDPNNAFTNIFFNDIDDAVAPTSVAELDALDRTTAFVAVDSQVYTIDVPVQIDILAVVQEIVDRTGWASGNDMILLWDDDGTDVGRWYSFYSFEGSGDSIALHIEYIGPQTDPSEMVRTLLSDNWNAANTDSRTPVFVTSVDAENVSSRQSDVIKVFESRPRNKTRQDHRYDFATRTAVITVQVDIGFTPSGVTLPQHSANVLQEVERVIQSQRSNPDDYWDLLEQDTFTFQHQYRNFARNIMNVNCKRIVRQIPGT